MMRMSIATANVTGPEGSDLSWTKMMAETRGDKLIIRRRSGEVLYSVAASAVRPQAGGVRLVDTEIGVFTIKRACNCGSR